MALRVVRLEYSGQSGETFVMQHDAHHRGQICMLARALGHEFSGADTMRLWGWKAISPGPRRRGARRAAKLARAHS